MPYQRIATVIGNKAGEDRESLFGIGGFEQAMSIYLIDALLGIVFGDAPIGYNLYLLNLLDFAVYGDVMIGNLEILIRILLTLCIIDAVMVWLLYWRGGKRG